MAEALATTPAAEDLRFLQAHLPQEQFEWISLNEKPTEANRVDLIHMLRERDKRAPVFSGNAPCVESIPPGNKSIRYEPRSAWSVLSATQDRTTWFERGGALDRSSLSFGVLRPGQSPEGIVPPTLPAPQRDVWVQTYFSPSAFVNGWLRVYGRMLNRSFVTSEAALPYLVSPFGFFYAGDHQTIGTLATRMATGRIHEEPEVELLRFFLPHIKTFIDIGANTGYYGFIAVHEGRPGTRSIMVEPQPDCLAAMRQTIWLNQWEKSVRLWPIGLADQPGSLTLHLTATGSSFDNSFNDNAPLPTLDVAVDTLDHRLTEESIAKVDFIKIDVEGFEASVLKGAVSTIERDKPVLLIEIADGVKGRAYRNPHYHQTLEWLAGKGYRVWRLAPGYHLEEAFPIQPQTDVAMYLCLHREAHQPWMTSVQAWMRQRRRRHTVSTLKRATAMMWRGLVHPTLAVRAIRQRAEHPEEGLRF